MNKEWVNMVKSHFMDIWECYNRTFLNFTIKRLAEHSANPITVWTEAEELLQDFHQLGLHIEFKDNMKYLSP